LALKNIFVLFFAFGRPPYGGITAGKQKSRSTAVTLRHGKAAMAYRVGIMEKVISEGAKL